MKLTNLIFILFIFLTFNKKASATVLLDFNYAGSAMTMGSATNRENTNYIGRFGLFLNPSVTGRFMLGGGVNYISQNVKVTNVEAYTAIDYYFGAKWGVTKKNWLWLGAYYAPNSDATFKLTDGTTETWSGATAIGSVSIYYPNTLGLMIGFSFDYYMGIFNKKTTDTASTNSNQTVSGFYPSASISYLW